MRTRVQKWGNSLAVRIPKSFAAEAGLKQDSAVDVSLEEGRLVVSPAAESDFTLGELLSKINKHNLHQEVNTGPPAGNEAW